MSWLDVFTSPQEIRPARPADENLAGRKIDQGAVGTSSTSSTSSNKTRGANLEEDLPPVEHVADSPTPEQITHATRMMVDCPNTPGVKWHCWYCSRCDRANKCNAWRYLAADVKWFKLSGPPYSLLVAESIQDGSEVML